MITKPSPEGPTPRAPASLARRSIAQPPAAIAATNTKTAVKRNGTDSGAIARLADRDRPISTKAKTTAATSNAAPALKWSRSDAVDVSRMSIYLT